MSDSLQYVDGQGFSLGNRALYLGSEIRDYDKAVLLEAWQALEARATKAEAGLLSAFEALQGNILRTDEDYREIASETYGKAIRAMAFAHHLNLSSLAKLIVQLDEDAKNCPVEVPKDYMRAWWQRFASAAGSARTALAMANAKKAAMDGAKEKEVQDAAN